MPVLKGLNKKILNWDIKISKYMLTNHWCRCIIIKSRRKTQGHGILAQLGEHLPYKQRVTGSSPVGPI